MEYELGELLPYEQPADYIVESTDYDDSYKTPVLTAGKSFIIGYTNETKGIYTKLPVIIFDDFTTSSQYVDFPFKVKSSAMKILSVNSEIADLKYLFYKMQTIQFDSANHKRYWISEYSKIKLDLPTLAEQQRIVNRIETMFAKLDQAQEKAQTVLDSFETRKAAILHKAFNGQLKIDNEELSIEDWEDTTIGECCRLGSGGTPSKSHPEYYENGDIPWLKTGEIDWNDIYDVEERITNEGVENSSAKIFPAESVVVAMYGMGVTRGKAAIIKIPTATNQAVCVLQPNEKLNNRFLFYYFMCNYWQIREQSVGGNQLNLSGKIIASFPIKLPPLNYQLSIVNFLDTVLEKESRAKETSQTVLDQIAMLKKSILARAFRGEL